jgi:hypothetical protein
MSLRTLALTPLIYPTNSFRSDGRPQPIRCYGKAVIHIHLGVMAQHVTFTTMTRRPYVGAAGV